MVALADLSRMQLYLENSYNQDENQDYSVAKQSVISAASCLVCQSNTQHYRFSVRQLVGISTLISMSEQDNR